MRSSLSKGILNSLSFYGVGTLCSLIVHLIFGWEYAHAPPLSFGVILIFMLMGFIRVIMNISNIRSNKEREKNQGELIVHALPALAFITLILCIIFIP